LAVSLITEELLMAELPALRNWIEEVATHLPHLSKPQAQVLALWSFGMVVAQSCGITSVAGVLAKLLGKKENSVRQQLREGYQAARDKKGSGGKGIHRQALDVSTCFAPLVRWILSAWPPTERRLALAMDATTLADRFTVLAISIVYRGCAIPVAWAILPAATPGSWQPHWVALFEDLRTSLPSEWTVIVLADRGLYAKWLYQAIERVGWHPYLRINTGGKYRWPNASAFQPLSRVVPNAGQAWSGRVVCFKSNPLTCTLLARRDEHHIEPWLIITDLSPEQADVCWYALRAWIESGFKDTKRGGWQWQHTQITKPDRAARHWLGIALATFWVVSVGGEADATLPVSSLTELPENHIARRHSPKHSQPRLLSCFRRGVIHLLCGLLMGAPVPIGRFYPEPWPTSQPQMMAT
jgi:hypothetical protein